MSSNLFSLFSCEGGIEHHVWTVPNPLWHIRTCAWVVATALTRSYAPLWTSVPVPVPVLVPSHWCRHTSLHTSYKSPFTVVVIMVGTNDLGYNEPAASILSSVKGLHALCHARGVKTVGISIPPNAFSSQPIGDEYSDRWREANGLIKQWLEECTVRSSCPSILLLAVAGRHWIALAMQRARPETHPNPTRTVHAPRMLAVGMQAHLRPNPRPPPLQDAAYCDFPFDFTTVGSGLKRWDDGLHMSKHGYGELATMLAARLGPSV